MNASRRLVMSSHAWVVYFQRNAKAVTSDDFKPPVGPALSEEIRKIVAGSLPAWQLGETSDGRHLRAAARQYALEQKDPQFLEAVDLFIREEQRHGAALGDWLDRVGIPRRRRDLGDSLFRCCRYAIPNYAVWASVVVMVEAMAEIYYASVRRVSPCLRLQAECDRILRDEVMHIQFQCEHLAVARRELSRGGRWILYGVEMAFYAVVCGAVFAAHGRLLACAGMPLGKFARAAVGKFRYLQTLMNPGRYELATRRDAVSERGKRGRSYEKGEIGGGMWLRR